MNYCANALASTNTPHCKKARENRRFVRSESQKPTCNKKGKRQIRKPLLYGITLGQETFC